MGAGGDGGFERTLSGDIRCSSPDEFVPSDCVSEPWFENKCWFQSLSLESLVYEIT